MKPSVLPAPHRILNCSAPWAELTLLRVQPQPHQAVAVPAQAAHRLTVHLGAPGYLERRLGKHLEKANMTAGAISLVDAGEPCVVASQGRGEVLHVLLGPNLLGEELREAVGANFGSVRLLNRFNIRDPFVEQTGRALDAELAADPEDALGALYQQGLAQALAVHVLRRHSALAGPRAEAGGGLTPRQLRRVLDYVDAHLATDLRLDELAGVLGISAYHFAHLFRTSMQMPPYQYVLRQRMHRAQQLLRHHRLSVREVAFAVGYTSQSHFTRAFRRVTGATPGAFRAAVCG